MIPRECKRIIEVDFPIAVVSKHAPREKGIPSGHPSRMHLWWARRPLAACRTVLLGLLLPDPCDPLCPAEFKTQARKRLLELRGRPEKWTKLIATDEGLRTVMLQFIGDFAIWDNASDASYLDVGRGIVNAAHPEKAPLVVDPFAGGGSIPLEALRLGCDAFASDLNPVACLILKVMLEDIPRHGTALADELRRVGKEIKEAVEEELAEFYPPDPDGARPMAYLWARTVRCEAPNCGAEIPLVRSFWLCKKASRKRAIRTHVERSSGQVPQIELEIFEPKTERDVPTGTVNRAKARCLACNAVLGPERVRTQLATQRGGADVIFDKDGKRIGGARLLAVVMLKHGETGRIYRLPESRDYEAVRKAIQLLLNVAKRPLQGGLSPIPTEPLPPIGTLGFRVQRYGMLQWGDLFTARQKLALIAIAHELKGKDSRALALALGKLADLATAGCVWHTSNECPGQILTTGRIKPFWDFSEAVPIGESSGGIAVCIEKLIGGVGAASVSNTIGQVAEAPAQCLPIDNESVDCWFTDPPYYDAIPYSDLSDFFFVWLKRALPDNQFFQDHDNPENPLTPKMQEIVQDETKRFEGHPKDRAFFEAQMAKVFAEGRRVLRKDGIGCVVFAHKTTEGWEALLSGMIRGGWVITCSWPIATEMVTRLRARESAALSTSVHLICRPRIEEDVGDWQNVARELPRRVREWMNRLQAEGIRGADLVFACIGPALEIYSRYAKVVDAQDREVPLGGDPEAKEPHKRGYLAYVWETVARLALEQVLGGEGRGAGLEEDARLTALFLWTLQSTNAEAADESADDESEDAGEDEEDDAPKPKGKGYSLIFDVARRFAQPLGIRLDAWQHRIIEIEKGVVRLLPVTERAKQLFGDEGADVVAAEIEAHPGGGAVQLKLFADEETPKVRGRRGKASFGAATDDSFATRNEATTLDRVHAAMLLQRAGRTQALRALLSAEKESGTEFERLANALSALYPRDSEEKRLLDAMLLAMPR